MVTRQRESDIRAIFRKHLISALEEINENSLFRSYLGDGCAERFAEQATQSLCMIEEASELTIIEGVA